MNTFEKIVALMEVMPEEKLLQVYEMIQSLDVTESIVRLISRGSKIIIGNRKFQVYEIVGNESKFKDMFGAFNRPLDGLCMSKAEIDVFKNDHRSWLKDDRWLFFLYEEGGKYLVAGVILRVDGSLYEDADPFEFSVLWDAEPRHRIVVPRPVS